MKPTPRRCRACGCTDADCRECILRTGRPCTWVAEDLCSAYQDLGYNTLIRVRLGSDNVASVRVGGRTHSRSCTESGARAAEFLGEKVGAAVGASAWRVEHYRTLSHKAARAALFLEFNAEHEPRRNAVAFHALVGYSDRKETTP